jgi:hypothetical protein
VTVATGNLTAGQTRQLQQLLRTMIGF